MKIKAISDSNIYYGSNGSQYTQAQINILISKAKEKVIEKYLDTYGYLFCVDCKKSGGIIEMSHEISIKEAKEKRQVELCWDTKNIKPRCHSCHANHDKLF